MTIHALARCVLTVQLLCCQTFAEESNSDTRYMQESRLLTRAVALEIQENGRWQTVKLHAEPCLKFGDPTRASEHGTVWVWGRTGRPGAVAELYENAAKQWIFVFCNTSGTQLREQSEILDWGINQSQLKMKPLVGAPKVAGQPRLRQLQLRQLARQFTAHEFWDPDNSRYELRLLPQPLFTYQDPDNNVLDGALFAFANGTNPEVLLFLEATREGEALEWRYGTGRLAHAEVHLFYEKTEVYTDARVDGPTPASEPYYLQFYTAFPEQLNETKQ